nr:MAG TPA: hypothetical protein [Caudoviricetes sp.]
MLTLVNCIGSICVVLCNHRATQMHSKCKSAVILNKCLVN